MIWLVIGVAVAALVLAWIAKTYRRPVVVQVSADTSEFQTDMRLLELDLELAEHGDWPEPDDA